ncbi:MAG: permease, partial [Desulfobacteraceae bacterium]|nr:permease [Desulfobacteraceae bacterium]
MMALNLLMAALGVYLWWTVYRVLPDLSKWLTYKLLPIQEGSHLGSSVEFFLYDTPKVMMLLFLVV